MTCTNGTTELAGNVVPICGRACVCVIPSERPPVCDCAPTELVTDSTDADVMVCVECDGNGTIEYRPALAGPMMERTCGECHGDGYLYDGHLYADVAAIPTKLMFVAQIRRHATDAERQGVTLTDQQIEASARILRSALVPAGGPTAA